ncbi:MAG: DUF2939 domain-containing protein [Moraxella sp.]|uniref:DUF2939 domain-containing protein n=1 Tax=Moraxella sp. TaxID=479 RepID=UPI0026DD75C6|nr:DUF2939 domain-containing protein [Moraxella sp.]MDO4449447.1 DUF2939 domain-containing protein [Moraxella sp.]
MKKFWLAFLVIMCVVGVIVLSPYYTLYQIKSAYQAGDYDKVISYVDIPRTQQHIKTILHARLDETLNNNPKLVGLTTLFPNIKDTLSNRAKQEINKTTEQAINADNLKKLLTNDISADSKKLVAVWAVASDYVDYESLVKDLLVHDLDTAIHNQESIITKKVVARFGKAAPSDASLRYCGLHRFMVTGNISNQPTGIILTRDGMLRWQITQIILP